MSESIPIGENKKQIALGCDWDEAAHQKAQAEEAFTYAAADFRRRVSQSYEPYFGKENEAGWVFFALASKPVPGETAEYNTDREILIIRQPVPGHPALTIRILTNETFGSLENGNILTEDFILDHENDAQYFIDALAFKDHTPQLPSFSTLFCFDQGKLQLINSCPLPPLIYVSADDKDGAGSLPFGHYKNIQDKIDALEYGVALLGEVENLTPDKWSGN